MVGNEEDEDFPATQPVMSLLLKGVVAYVEVRSGHDNRSRGVKTQLRNLGAKVEDSFNNNVTHVVFNEGLPSTYKKAKKLKCHIVSVLWIEACKEQLMIVSEAGYPPIGQQIYENPQSLKNFKKLKSMQPDFDDEIVDAKIDQIRKRIQRRQAKARPTPNISDDQSDGMPPPKVPNFTETQEKTSKKSDKKSNKGKLKAAALNEITPDVVNKSSKSDDTEVTTSTTQKVEALQQLSHSSSSAVFGEMVKEAGPSKKRKKKVAKPYDDAPMTRGEFIDSLSGIVLSLSKENDSETTEISPWRRRVGPPPIPKPKRKTFLTNQPSPRRSPRNVASPLNSFITPSIPPKRSSQLANGTRKLPNTCPAPSITSASATLVQKNKLPAALSSPGDGFILLSQETGDMPSLEEMAKQHRGSIRAGDERITLSQIVRSYNAVAQGATKSPISICKSTVRSSQHQGSSKSRSECSENVSVIVDDEACDAEVRHCESRCSSEAESSVSSTSTRVLINGKPSLDMACSSTLPSSGEIDVVVPNSSGESCPAQDQEREPSPIFVIKKAKLRKPLKKQTVGSSLPKSPGISVHAASTGSFSNKSDGPCSSDQKKPSMNPINYINKLLLPKFLVGDKTPGSVQVLVEETPDVRCVSTCVADPLVIPPTPAENNVPSVTVDAVSPSNQSLANSVISWVKKSCKVPLFSSRSNTLGTAAKEQSPPSRSARRSPCNQQEVQINISSCEEISEPPDKDGSQLCSASSSKKFQHGGKGTRKARKTRGGVVTTVEKNNQYVTSVKNTSKPKTRKRVEVTVEVDDQEIISLKKDSGQDNGPVKLSPAVSQIGQSSSGYETSNSVACKEHATIRSCPDVDEDEPSVKRPKRITDLLSPIMGPSQNRSEVYEIDEIAGSPVTGPVLDSNNGSQNKSGVKRSRSLQNSSNKKQKLNHSDPQLSIGSRTTRASRADSKFLLSTSRSDLSADTTKSLGRKSSEEAKKRMARSLTRSYSSNVPKVIVCTFLTTSEQNGIEVAGENLQGWKLEEKVTSRTTHVINSGPKRTLNMLKGMARGCWLVDQNWMLDSSKAGVWLEEEKYELVKFSPAVKLCRVRQQAMGKDYRHTLFARVGAIFVSPKLDGPPPKDIRELLELCGADLTSSPREAKIAVGNVQSQKGTFQSVQPCWVLDCITKNKILPINDAQYKI